MLNRRGVGFAWKVGQVLKGACQREYSVQRGARVGIEMEKEMNFLISFNCNYDFMCIQRESHATLH